MSLAKFWKNYPNSPKKNATNYVHASMSTIRDFCPFFRSESEASNLENAKRSPLIK
jgi:hypothetical protein